MPRRSIATRDTLNSGNGTGTGIVEGPSQTLSGRVLGLMREDIMQLRLPPGTKLLFDTLREKYDVGLSPLREALSRLVVEEFVVGEDRRGFRVAPLTEEDFYDLTALRREIEVLAVTRSVERGDDMWEAELVRAFHHMTLSDPDKPEYMQDWSTRHQAFHEALVSACGSPRLLQLRRQLFDQFLRYQRIAPRNIWQSAVNDTRHKPILDAAIARDVEKCRELIKGHIKGQDPIVQALRAFGGKA